MMRQTSFVYNGYFAALTQAEQLQKMNVSRSAAAYRRQSKMNYPQRHAS
jgi:hypothetical protein